jgi:hypothetical protein
VTFILAPLFQPVRGEVLLGGAQDLEDGLAVICRDQVKLPSPIPSGQNVPEAAEDVILDGGGGSVDAPGQCSNLACPASRRSCKREIGLFAGAAK